MAVEQANGSDTAHQKPITIYSLSLEHDGSPSKAKSYVRLPAPHEPYTLRLSLEPGSPASKNGKVITNLPARGASFSRKQVRSIDFPSDLNRPIQVDLEIAHAGAYEYHVEYDAPRVLELDDLTGPSKQPKRLTSRPGYFNVDPLLRIAQRLPILNGQDVDWEHGGDLTGETVPIPLDGLVIQTVVGKWMGAVSEWEPHLRLVHDAGYNMLHFTPLQERGRSNSPYSIYDQLQFSDDLFSDKMLPAEKTEKMRTVLQGIQENYGILAMTDVVWNHTADNTHWLHDHPEAGYNAVNSPHLQAALEVDEALLRFSHRLDELQLPTIISSSRDLDRIAQGIKDHVLPELRLWEYYAIDVAHEQERFLQRLKTGDTGVDSPQSSHDSHTTSSRSVLSLNVLDSSSSELAQQLVEAGLTGHETLGSRSSRRLTDGALESFVRAARDRPESKVAIQKKLAKAIDDVNVAFYKEYDDDVKSIVDQTINRANYVRLDPNGPRIGEITKNSPLIESLFTRLKRSDCNGAPDGNVIALANNGWMWNANPLEDFAGPRSKAYLRREVIVWADCVKLRYGNSPEDNPWLWSHMAKYTESVASLFQGIRIDNCHSTPLHVAEYLLDAARRISPNVYVCAELFTGSEEMDVHFVSRLGINSLIREAMNAWDAKEESRLIYRHGIGRPIGSVSSIRIHEQIPPLPRDGPKCNGHAQTAVVNVLQGSAPHALFMDVTHDNEAPAQKRTAEDALATGALVAFSDCAIGSNRGFDDLYPKLLDIVKENRHYNLPDRVEDSGIGKAKKLLNHLHVEMSLAGFVEGHVHQENDYITVHRKHPQTHQGYLLIAHTAISSNARDKGQAPPIVLDRTKAKFLFGATLEVHTASYNLNKSILKGFDSSLKDLSPPQTQTDDNRTEIYIPEGFAAGSILVYRTWIEGLDSDLDNLCISGAESFNALSLTELNTVLYKCDGEEWDTTSGHDGVYNVPSYGKLVYAGLEGWMHPLRIVIRHNDLGHALCKHLREGTWAMDYVSERLLRRFSMSQNLRTAAAWFRERFDKIKGIPAFLRPKYFAMIISTAYEALCQAALKRMGSFVQHGDAFTQSLALTLVQMHGLSRSASLYPIKSVPSLAAGLPHFTHEWARCWGRDVFICLRGLCLVTEQWDIAREHICAFASVLKHGLIPNLLDSGNIPRYNSRDSPWFFLQSIQDYAEMAPSGIDILELPVQRRFDLDDEVHPFDDPRSYRRSSTVAEVMQEIMQRHADGIRFREYKAGSELDTQMSDKGFDIEVHVDWTNGMIFGGSQYNCGTWQDKMGESAKAGNKGVPGTPRDGAAIEITGLVKSAVRWLSRLHDTGKFSFEGVNVTIDGSRHFKTYKEWNQLLQLTFEKCYYVPIDADEDGSYDIDSTRINRRGIYKDLYRSGKGHEDYQLRANFPIAMTVAPELFEPKHALTALMLARKYIKGPLGMATLDPSDQDYRPTYDNANDSDDYRIAKGRNYHQGPEWVWLTGFFLRAYYKFDLMIGSGAENPQETLHDLHSLLLRHRQHVRDSPWAGLPELTNRDGDECHDSCDTQAWSNSCILDLLYDSRLQ